VPYCVWTDTNNSLCREMHSATFVRVAAAGAIGAA
jgi:hypothetical protein